MSDSSPPHGNYQDLLAYHKAEVVYDIRVWTPWNSSGGGIVNMLQVFKSSGG